MTRRSLLAATLSCGVVVPMLLLSGCGPGTPKAKGPPPANLEENEIALYAEGMT